MATHALTDNFRSFVGNLNPSSTTEQTAAAEYLAVKTLIEDRNGPASVLSPVCFLQGSDIELLDHMRQCPDRDA